MSGARPRIKMTCVKHIHIPQYEGLDVKKILDWAAQYPDAMMHLPESRKETMKMPKEYICNVLHTTIGDPFYQWVMERIAARDKKVIENHNEAIEMDPEMAAVFYASTSVSGKFQNH